jgi:hypothetical protein
LRDGTAQSVCSTISGDSHDGGTYVSQWCRWELGRTPACSPILWRSHAQTTSGDLQPSSSAAPYCERQNWSSIELSFVFRSDRAQPGGFSSRAVFARHVALSELRPPREVHRRRRVAPDSPACLTSRGLSAEIRPPTTQWFSARALPVECARSHFPNSSSGNELGTVCSPGPTVGERGKVLWLESMAP